MAAGAGAGYLISREVSEDKVHTAHVQKGTEEVWATSRETLEILSDLGTELTLQETPRMMTTKVNGALVEVEVEAYDLDRTVLRVRAEKYLGSDSRTAEQVLTHILDRLVQ